MTPFNEWTYYLLVTHYNTTFNLITSKKELINHPKVIHKYLTLFFRILVSSSFKNHETIMKLCPYLFNKQDKDYCISKSMQNREHLSQE